MFNSNSPRILDPLCFGDYKIPEGWKWLCVVGSDLQIQWLLASLSRPPSMDFELLELNSFKWNWIFSYWSGFFDAEFTSLGERQVVLDFGPYFLGTLVLFMEPWYPIFYPSTTSISSAPVLVRLINLPLHLWNSSLLKHIGVALGTIIFLSPDTKGNLKTKFSRICVETDFGKGFPTEVHLTSKDYTWVKKLDYENVLFLRQACFRTSHLAKHFPKVSLHLRRSHNLFWWDGSKPERYIIHQ